MRSRALALLPFAALFAAAVPASAAAPKDAQAQKALKEALDVDYLETKFDRAEQKLRTAIETCGEEKCSPPLKAQLYAALGVVLAGGKKELEDAREAFVEALKVDPTIKLDPDILSAQIEYAFDQAKKQLGIDQSPAGESGPSGKGLTHKPPAEQRVDTPLPIYLELEPDLVSMAKKVTVTYLAPGSSEWKTLVLKPMRDRGFGINVPCADTKAGARRRFHGGRRKCRHVV